MKVKAYAAKSSNKPLEYFEFERREPTAKDVELEILYCGICHSDIHMARNEWSDWDPTKYPSVVGHEIIGKVTRVGKNIKKHKVGDIVGVGVLVNSCRECSACKESLEQYCENGNVGTYNGIDPIDGQVTKGGYSSHQVVQEDFVFKIPKGMDLAKTAPLLCAGITTFSPLKHWGTKKGKKVGIIGLGGLGHMALKYSIALGAETHVITTSSKKVKDAKKYGATGVVVISNKKQVKEAENTFDLLINTVPVAHDFRTYIELLRTDGVMVIVGAISELTHGFHGWKMISKRRSIAGSMIGGLKEVQQMLNFSAKKGVYADVEVIKMKDINKVFDKIVKKGVSHRYVIDIKNSFKS